MHQKETNEMVSQPFLKGQEKFELILLLLLGNQITLMKSILSIISILTKPAQLLEVLKKNPDTRALNLNSRKQ